MSYKRFRFLSRLKFDNMPFFNISFRLHYHWFFVLLLTPYLLWELYWAYKVGYACVKWHTRLMALVYLWLAGYLILYYTLRLLHHRAYQFALVAFSATMTIVIIVEASLNFLKVHQTIIESISGSYGSYYKMGNESRYHAYAPHREYWLSKPEYRFGRKANSLGFPDSEWRKQKLANEIRILCSGDSYTEGDGAPYDSSYVALLRQKFLPDTSVYIMNAGICGNDPFMNYIAYHDILYAYQPDVIIQTLSSGDIIVDLIVRGGMERFLSDGTVQFKRPPWWEPVYALSYLSRLFFHAAGYDQLLIRLADIQNLKPGFDRAVVNLFREYAALAQKNNSLLVVVLHPYAYELTAMEYQYDFTNIASELRETENIEFIDLMPFYKKYAEDKDEDLQSYFWLSDGHHNSKGYAVMAEGIYRAIADLPLFSDSTNTLVQE